MRIRLELPDKYIFTTEIQILVHHLNYGNHLGNDSVLSIIHEARVRFLHHLGYTEKDIDGTGVIMTDVAIIYKSEGFYGQVLKIDIGVKDLENKSFDLYYHVNNETTGKLLATAKTGILGFDYSSGKPKSFSEKFLNLIGE